MTEIREANDDSDKTSENLKIVKPNDRITSFRMSLYEYCNVVSVRANQIQNTNKTFTNVGLETDPIKMAEMEILHKKCPLAIVRKLNNHEAELFNVNEMTLP